MQNIKIIIFIILYFSFVIADNTNVTCSIPLKPNCTNAREIYNGVWTSATASSCFYLTYISSDISDDIFVFAVRPGDNSITPNSVLVSSYAGPNGDTPVSCVQTQTNQTNDDYDYYCTNSELFTGYIIYISVTGEGSVEIYVEFEEGTISDCTEDIISSSLEVWMWVLIGISGAFVYICISICCSVGCIGGIMYIIYYLKKQEKVAYKLYEDA